MKKFITLLIAGVLLIGLCGCGNLANTDSLSTTSNDISKVDLPNDHYGEGMYKVGKDIPAGEYWIIATEKDYSGYFCVSSDSSGDSIIFNENFDTWVYVTVKNGEYIEITRAEMCPSEKAPDMHFNSSAVLEGIYKIGKDLPAGEYKLVAAEVGNDGYYAVLSSSYNYSDNIVANDNFSNNAYITVQDGQYLQISRALGEKVD